MEAMQQNGINHLFVDSNGFFNSYQKKCILTGIFYQELERENSTVEELQTELLRVKDAINSLGETSLIDSLTVPQLLLLAKTESNFIDFRLGRTLIDGIKEKTIKSGKHPAVISSLTRLLIFQTSKLISNEKHFDQLVRFDTRLHEKLAEEYLFCFSKIHVVTKGVFTCPMKSFYVLCHNQPIEQLELHPLI